MKWLLLHKFVALLLATNYFAFQAELFEEEYEENHPKPAETCSLNRPSITWESFDKQNAPEAFVVDAGIQLEFLFLCVAPHVKELLPNPQYQPIRDKSPPPIKSVNVVNLNA